MIAKAASNAASDPRFGMVYVGPAWETVGTSPTRGAVRTWKLAVLERRPGAGAIHWGHLFLVVGQAATDVMFRPEAGTTGVPHRPPPEPVPSRPDLPLRVHMWPIAPESAPKLREFALEFQRQVVGVVGD